VWHAVIAGPLTLLRLRGRALGLFVVYLLLAAGVLGLGGWLVLRHRGDALALLAAYLFPESWRLVAEQLIERFFENQVRAVLVNAAVSASLGLLALLLFRVKERLSIAVEKQLELSTGPTTEFSLPFQAWEELVLVLALVASQMTVFWVGYPPDPTRRQWATVLSYLVLFVSYAMNFISPILQRHRLRYGTIAKVLVRRPLAALAFGALFSLPPILVGKWVATQVGWPLWRTLGVLGAVNVLSIAWAAVAGTWLGSRLLPVALQTPRASVAARLLGWATLLGVFAVNVFAFSSVAMSLHHKSQLLKCHYTLVPSSLHIDLPKWSELNWKEVKLGLRADVDIENPTTFDVDVERNRLIVRFDAIDLAEARLSPLSVPAGERRVTHIELPVVLRPEVLKHWPSGFSLSNLATLAELSHWDLTLYLQVAPHFEWPIHLLTPRRP